MLGDFFATKLKMTQIWTQDGKRIPVTIVKSGDIKIVGQQKLVSKSKNITSPMMIIEVGLGKKKLANVSKPMRARLEKHGFSEGVTKVTGVRVAESDMTDALSPGKTIAASDVLTVGDKVFIQGTTKGSGFTGAVKRYGFKGGPRTHGQSDRVRAVGSIGPGTTPGRVYKGKRMPGHAGVEVMTIKGSTVLHIDIENQEVWLSGPIPGAPRSILRIRKTGDNQTIAIDKKASGITDAPVVETTPEVADTTETAQA